jgi:hypothetical protein
MDRRELGNDLDALIQYQHKKLGRRRVPKALSFVDT